jgi:hypothetical protein
VADEQVAILVSCIGRKLLLGQRIAEEVEAVQGVLGMPCDSQAFTPMAKFRRMRSQDAPNCTTRP